MNLNRLKALLPRSFKRAVKLTLRNIWESAAYRVSRRRSDDEHWRHLVFVCKGNICRSAFAEFYLKSSVSTMSHETIRVESCGLDVDQGIFSPPEAIEVGGEFGIDLSSNRSKGLPACDLQSADLIVPMEYRQYLRLKTMFPDMQKKIKLLREFSPWPDRIICNISDPYGLEEKEFRYCFRKMQRALDGLKCRVVNR